jgi:adenylosuccinate lyase
MRRIFSEKEKRATWRKVWLALASAQSELGLLTKAELNDLRRRSGVDNVDIPAALAIESEIGHDLMAELKVFAGQAKLGGGRLHLGATSADIEDNADILLYARALGLISSRLIGCLRAARVKIYRYRDKACMAWTHMQPAEPTTLGYRFAMYAQDLLMDAKLTRVLRDDLLRGKGMKGAVGTSASYKALLGGDERARKMEEDVMKSLGLEPLPVASQTYPRKLDFLLLSCLASIAESCHKFGVDLRVMQSPAFGELAEPSSRSQVGSSAMPFKRNPVLAERMCSLARLVGALPSVAFANAANAVLERTLDDSASRRVVMPEAFLAVDECLMLYQRIIEGLQVNPAMIKHNLEKYGMFSGTEAVMMELAKRGEDRQKVHEMIRKRSAKAWDDVIAGKPNPLLRMLEKERMVSSRMTSRELRDLMVPENYIGDAPRRCQEFLRREIDPFLATTGGFPRRAAGRA